MSRGSKGKRVVARRKTSAQTKGAPTVPDRYMIDVSSFLSSYYFDPIYSSLHWKDELHVRLTTRYVDTKAAVGYFHIDIASRSVARPPLGWYIAYALLCVGSPHLSY
jgi:hypothetical protein